MSHPDASKPTVGDYAHELHNAAVHSALQIAVELPQLYDKIYKDFPKAYNNAAGNFGRISVVKMAKDMRSKPETYFTEQPVEYAYPDGLIMPLVYGLKALLHVDDKGHVRWKDKSTKFLDAHLESIVSTR